MPDAFTQWQPREYPAGDAPFRPAEMLGPQPFAHDALDALRMSWRSTPEATYPDGYLNTIRSRREDRLLDGIKTRTNKPYTRGIHKGERIDPTDYVWPQEFNLWTGLEYQAAGVRFSPPGLGADLPFERYPTDRRVGPKGRGVPTGGITPSAVPGFGASPDRTNTLRSMAPPWEMRGNPGMAVPYPGR